MLRGTREKKFTATFQMEDEAVIVPQNEIAGLHRTDVLFGHDSLFAILC